MRTLCTLLVAMLVLGLGIGAASAEQPAPPKRPLSNVAGYRPQLALHPLPAVTEKAFTTVSGVVFSHTPLDRVMVGDRTAALREAEPEDLVKLQRTPPGASDAPYRTYFEVPDAGLSRVGVNDLEIRAIGSDGRASDIHRTAVVRTGGAAPAKP